MKYFVLSLSLNMFLALDGYGSSKSEIEVLLKELETDLDKFEKSKQGALRNQSLNLKKIDIVSQKKKKDSFRKLNRDLKVLDKKLQDLKIESNKILYSLDAFKKQSFLKLNVIGENKNLSSLVVKIDKINVFDYKGLFKNPLNEMNIFNRSLPSGKYHVSVEAEYLDENQNSDPVIETMRVEKYIDLSSKVPQIDGNIYIEKIQSQKDFFEMSNEKK